MKHILLISILASQLAWADCNIRSASINQNQTQVGNITNLIKTISYGKCSVKFQLTVDGTVHSLEGEWRDFGPEDTLCTYAIDQARTQFLAGLGGKFQTDTLTKCVEGDKFVKDKVNIGDTILESEVGPSTIKGYFKYKGAKCRMFQDHFEFKRKLTTYNGVICQIDNSDTNWLVVDKW
jgi:hypothetical protein